MGGWTALRSVPCQTPGPFAHATPTLARVGRRHMSEMMREREREGGEKRGMEARAAGLDEQLREAKTQLAVLQSQAGPAPALCASAQGVQSLLAPLPLLVDWLGFV